MILPPYRQSCDGPNVNGIPVERKTIKLCADTVMDTGYIGRGRSSVSKTFRAGTEVQYSTFPKAGRYAARNAAEITHWVHTVMVREGGLTYYATVTKEVQK